MHIPTTVPQTVMQRLYPALMEVFIKSFSNTVATGMRQGIVYRGLTFSKVTELTWSQRTVPMPLE